jgi:secreted trypsin-like serine protease
VIRHPKYDEVNVTNDIALIKLSRPVPYSDEIVPVCIPDESMLFLNDTATATGWRLAGDHTSNVLEQAELSILSEQECLKINEAVDYKTQICAAKRDNGDETFQGDYGGPLVVQDAASSKWYLAGITTYGVYTRTSAYKQWILNTIAIN